jgi:hypothetical protein
MNNFLSFLVTCGIAVYDFCLIVTNIWIIFLLTSHTKVMPDMSRAGQRECLLTIDHYAKQTFFSNPSFYVILAMMMYTHAYITVGLMLCLKILLIIYIKRCRLIASIPEFHELVGLFKANMKKEKAMASK